MTPRVQIAIQIFKTTCTIHTILRTNEIFGLHNSEKFGREKMRGLIL